MKPKILIGNTAVKGTVIRKGTVCSSDIVDEDLHELNCSPLESLLTSGGGSRLRIDPINLLNGYGCQPWPRPEAFTFASSTATSISDRAFAAAAAARRELIESVRKENLADVCDRRSEWLREQIRKILGLGEPGTEIVFSPSGTDSQIHALYVAQTMLDGPMVCVIVGSDETGSGTSRAMIGCHFSSTTARDRTVTEGERISGFAEDVIKVEISLRDSAGRLRSSEIVDKEVLAVVGKSVTSGKRVVLYVIDSSKFGSRCPSLNCLRQVQSTWGRSIQVIVDACQMRMSRRCLQYYLTENCMVLITGSKFFTGPPLSGALLVPSDVSAAMEKTDTLPAGLEHYTNRSDWPIAWRGVRSKLPRRPNLGQQLRWVAAVAELKAYFAVPTSYRTLALQEFSNVVQRLIAERQNLRLLPAFEAAEDLDGFDREEMAVRTIFPFFISDRGKLLSVETCGRIYRALNRDVSNLLPPSATTLQQEVAERLCHIGQPVGVRNSMGGSLGTLRISAGARVVSETWRPEGEAASLLELNRELEQVRLILDKVDFLVENVSALDDTVEVTKKDSATFDADSSRFLSSVKTAAENPAASGVRHG